MTTTQYDCLLKIVLIGDSYVGKTAFFESFLYDSQKTNTPTIGVDFGFKTINILDKRIKLQIWDTAGQERFRSITHSYYRGADIIVLMYDITNIQSFENIHMWYNNITNTNNVSKPYIILLIGNKIDLENKRVVTTEMGEEVAIKYGMDFIETSSYCYDSVHEIINIAIENSLKVKTDIISSSEKANILVNNILVNNNLINNNLINNNLIPNNLINIKMEQSDIIHVKPITTYKRTCCY